MKVRSFGVKSSGEGEALVRSSARDEVVRSAPSLPHGEPDEPSNHLLIEYHRILLRHKVLICGLATAGVLISILLHLTSQPVYKTRTSLDIQSINGEFMNMRSLDPTVAASSGESMIQTQIKLLQSDSLLERVQQRLTNEPHPLSVPRTDLLSRMQTLIHLGHPTPIPFPDLLEETAKGLKVKPLGITRLVEITCDSWDAAFSARFCNVLTNEFQAEDLENRGSDAKRTSEWLMHQADDTRQKAEDSQHRLMAATGGNGLILSQVNNTVGEDRLRQMQGELVKAQADRMEKEAQASVAKTASADATPSVVASPGYAAARTRLVDLQGQVAALIPPLTEANPRIIHLRSQIKDAQDVIARERTSSSQRLQNEFTAAKHREDLLSLAYRTQESSVSSDLEKGSQVSLLRREVESEQQLYQTLLQRAKEAGFASAMQASTIRVIDAAKKPRFPIFPQHVQAGTVGLISGLLLGIAISFFKDRSNVVLRLPGESERLLHVEELGVIPSPKAARALATKRGGALTVLNAQNGAAGASHGALQTARWGDRFSIVAEAYRSATLSILLSAKNKKARIFVVSSPSSGEGKTTVTTNLGVALSKANMRVVLIDGDLRKPSLHRVLSTQNKIGLRDVLRGEVSLSADSIATICVPTAFPKLALIPAGSGGEDVVELLHSSRFGDLLNRLSREFDVVLIDTPPMLHLADARIFAGQANGAILILRSGVTTREQATTARDLFDRDRVRIVGSILNDFNPNQEGEYGYYKSYYAYQAHQERDSEMAVGS